MGTYSRGHSEGSSMEIFLKGSLESESGKLSLSVWDVRWRCESVGDEEGSWSETFFETWTLESQTRNFSKRIKQGVWVLIRWVLMVLMSYGYLCPSGRACEHGQCCRNVGEIFRDKSWAMATV